MRYNDFEKSVKIFGLIGIESRDDIKKTFNFI